MRVYCDWLRYLGLSWYAKFYFVLCLQFVANFNFECCLTAMRNRVSNLIAYVGIVVVVAVVDIIIANIIVNVIVNVTS